MLLSVRVFITLQTDYITIEGWTHGMTVSQAILPVVDFLMLQAGIGQLFLATFSQKKKKPKHFQGDLISSQIILGKARMKWRGDGEVESIGI